MFFDGLSYSSNHGKINVYMFNALRSKKNISFSIKGRLFSISSVYVKVLAVYYAFADLFVALLGVISALVLKYKNFDFLIKLSCVFSLLNIFMILLLPKIRKKKSRLDKIEIYQDFRIQNYNQKLRNVRQILFDIFFSIQFLYNKNKSIFYLIFFSGLFNFIAWQMGPIYTFVLIEKGMSNFQLAKFGSISKILMAIGCVIPFIFNKKRISLKGLTLMILLFFLLNLGSSIVYNKYFIIFCSFFPSVFYAFFEGIIENYLDKNLKRSIRATVNSLSFVFSNLTSVFALLIFGYFSEYANQKIYFATSLALFLLAFFLRYLIGMHGKRSR
jgi:MFS family permease